eukprot:TRINITY_DN2650_c0_g4_i1.p1 TRINITY_DN2650_c0_g4~~TRINITY_DN2650_c0_g4_i1.p1  ORF type:complete len:125 (-),score=58.80 TRINITY_DN2650_c0_g4_i1:281-655(-)
MSTDENIEVTWEDQQMICNFGYLNSHLHETQAQITRQTEILNNLEDASNEIILLDDEVPVYCRIGETFFAFPKENAEQHIESLKELQQSKVDELTEKQREIKEKMATLKVQLYGKFKTSINLDE